MVIAPAPTRSDASEDAAHGDSYKTYPCKVVWGPLWVSVAASPRLMVEPYLVITHK